MNRLHVSLSGYWNEFVTRIVQSGMRPSKANVVEECLKARRRALENEFEAYADWRAEQKDRRELKHDNV